jgi:putative sigma-54 modulation protein
MNIGDGKRAARSLLLKPDERSGSVQINISARHGQLSDATREKIRTKAGKLARLFERLTAINVTIDLEHPEEPVVELLVSAEHKHDFVATDRSENLLASLENVVQKVEQQLRKYKEKIQEHRYTPMGQTPVEPQARPGSEAEYP